MKMTACLSPMPSTVCVKATRKGSACRVAACPENGVAARARVLNRVGAVACGRNTRVAVLFSVATSYLSGEYLAVTEGWLLTVDGGYLEVIKKEEDVIQT